MEQTYLSQYMPYILLAAGLALIALGLFYIPKKNRLKETGIPADGIVFEQSSTDAENSINERIIIRFVTKKQEWITAPMNKQSQMFYTGQYKDGETVKLYYNAANPYEFYVDTKQSPLAARMIMGIAGIVLTAASLYKIL